MPIEIKELHIKVSLTASPPPPAAGAGGVDAKDAIVADCVEQVLQILQNKAER